MRAWLEARRLKHGEELKKALRPAAEAEFGEAFRVRGFNAGLCGLLPAGAGTAEEGVRGWAKLLGVAAPLGGTENRSGGRWTPATLAQTRRSVVP